MSAHVRGKKEERKRKRGKTGVCPKITCASRSSPSILDPRSQTKFESECGGKRAGGRNRPGGVHHERLDVANHGPQQRGNNFKGFEDFYLTTKAGMWP